MPPENLKATPVPAVTTVASNRLGEYVASLVANPNPAPMTQHEAARQEPGRSPLAALILKLEAAFAIQPQAAIASIGAPIPDDVAAARHKPHNGGKNSHGHWQ